jgi:hypothetical protein
VASVASSTAELLERDAARSLTDAIAAVATARGRESRERHRELLERAIDQATRALTAAGGSPLRHATSILARAHAVRAEDALHGAGQLALGAQRAPTPAACDDGWARVEAIVSVAEEAARAAGRLVHDDSGAPHAARVARGRADAAARKARRMLGERNHAYTFHTDQRFSFGEGWYVAAAAVLAGVPIQIEPGMPATKQAERFLREAGLGDRLTPYRSRPRANKQTTEIVARAFRSDPGGAHVRLRTAFLGDVPIAKAVSDWIDPKLSECTSRSKVLVWVRTGAHAPGRNTAPAELGEIIRRALALDLVPIVLGDSLPLPPPWPPREGALPTGAVDMTLFWKAPIFRGDDGRRAQLQFFEHLRAAHGVIGQLGVTTAGMDGPALMGMPTMYITLAPNPRMGRWVGAVPGYEEVVRGAGYLDEVSRGMSRWGG